MKRFITYFSINLLALFFLFSCSNSTNVESKSEKLLASEWLLIGGKTSDGNKIDFNHEDRYTLIFKNENNLIGVADCNSYSGKYSLENGELNTSSLISTEIYCGKDSWISNYFEAISRVSKYHISNGKLKLYYSDDGYLKFESN